MNDILKDRVEEHQIPVKGFYNFYSVPWSQDHYIKFPTSMIIINGNHKMSFASSFDNKFEDLDLDSEDHVFEVNRDLFMQRHYLGSARETDTYRIKQVIGNRIELKL